ncbi:hypothetical protein CALCODRAFT_509447 [Calocera cornea HHB12733]|uniref:Uncharacterized protein n=1 Tax=Calocera cornea HHB12733 TaxID=1353952 RepID=A0A165FAN5_9BASI|nr:hypothetical protein CALCODRAFT_509447 [Calocera cornea HHB12733]
MSEQKNARSSADKEDDLVGGDSTAYQEEMALAVDIFAEHLQQAMLADIEDARQVQSAPGKTRTKSKRPRRMEQMLQGLFEYIERLAREEAKECEEDEELDEKRKGKEVEKGAKR